MFLSIIPSFLRPGSASIDVRFVEPELLACNFHESLNPKPLFVQLAGDISRSASPAKAEYADRLVRGLRGGPSAGGAAAGRG